MQLAPHHRESAQSLQNSPKQSQALFMNRYKSWQSALLCSWYTQDNKVKVQGMHSKTSMQACLYTLLFIPRCHAMSQHNNGLLSWYRVTTQASSGSSCCDIHAARVEGASRCSCAWHFIVTCHLLSLLTMIALLADHNFVSGPAYQYFTSCTRVACVSKGCSAGM